MVPKSPESRPFPLNTHQSKKMFLDGEPVAATLLSTLCGTFGHRHHSLDETRAGNRDEMVSVCAVLLIWSFHPDVSENAPREHCGPAASWQDEDASRGPSAPRCQFSTPASWAVMPTSECEELGGGALAAADQLRHPSRCQEGLAAKAQASTGDGVSLQGATPESQCCVLGSWAHQLERMQIRTRGSTVRGPSAVLGFPG